jgi:hypothetical protein
MVTGNLRQLIETILRDARVESDELAPCAVSKASNLYGKIVDEEVRQGSFSCPL